MRNLKSTDHFYLFNDTEIDVFMAVCFYDIWPELAKKAYEFSHNQVSFSDIDHIVFAGMGGSGTIGDIFSAILSKTEIYVTNVKGYLLPNTTNSKSVVIVTSVSGNTQETFSVLKDSIINEKSVKDNDSTFLAI